MCKKTDVRKIYNTTDGYFNSRTDIKKPRKVAVIHQRDDKAVAVVKIHSKKLLVECSLIIWINVPYRGTKWQNSLRNIDNELGKMYILWQIPPIQNLGNHLEAFFLSL